MSNLAATFDTIVNTVRGQIPPTGMTEIPADDAATEFQNTLLRTVLPRRITVRGADGARISVIAKNRRIINLSEVHPPSDWTGKAAPEQTECQADFDQFAGPFASAFLKAVNGKPIRIEQALLTDPLGAVKAGYPAGMLVDHVEQSLGRVPAGDQIALFLEANDGLPRARFGSEIEVTVPANAAVSHDWMQDRIDEALKDLAETKSDLRFLVLDGDAPMALALVWLEGEGAIVFSDDVKNFDNLEQKLSAFSAYL